MLIRLDLPYSTCPSTSITALYFMRMSACGYSEQEAAGADVVSLPIDFPIFKHEGMVRHVYTSIELNTRLRPCKAIFWR